MKPKRADDRRLGIREDITGQRSNQLTALWPAGRILVGKNRVPRIVWAAQCDCGKIVVLPTGNLKTKTPKSCGCVRAKTLKHATRRSPEYQAFRNAQDRCENPSNSQYRYYGGRGIRVRFGSFAEFLADIGVKPGAEYSLDRINNEGHYEAGNVRWATWKQQRANKRPRSCWKHAE